MTITDLAARMRERAGTKDPTSLPHSCRCGIRWSGANTAHCAAANCHRTFSGETTFSRHRRDGRCLDPREIGMSLIQGRAYECWGYPAATNDETTECDSCGGVGGNRVTLGICGDCGGTGRKDADGGAE